MDVGQFGIVVEIDVVQEIVSVIVISMAVYFFCAKYIADEDEMEKKIFFNGLKLKLIAAIALPLVYILYYKGGDTLTYFHDAMLLNELFWYDPPKYFDFIVNGMYENGELKTWKYYFTFRQMNLSYFIFRVDERAMFVSRITSVLTLLTGGSLFASGIIISVFCYLGLWKVYKIFIEYYPVFTKQLSYTVLFIPSVVFWGSGILKDPITLGALCFLVFYFHALMKKRNVLFSSILCFVSGYLILAIKPYILNAFIIGMGCWILSNYLVKIKSVVFKGLIFPFLLALSAGIIFLSLDAFSDKTGQYSLDKVLNEAVLVQNDLKQDYYGGHRFDIGTFDPSVGGLLSKAPIAIGATLYRPFIWEADNLFILMSALESTVIIIFSFIAIFRIKIHRLQGILLMNPLLFFSFMFSLFFAFSVGLTTANFGALVRYKIPLMPFYLSMVYVLSNYSKIPTQD